MKALRITVLFILAYSCVFSQKDSISKKKLKFIFGKDSNLVFSGTKVVEKVDTSENPKLTIGGYVSSYYAYYDDETSKNDFVQFPTICPRNNQFGLNMAMISMEYKSRNMRSNLVFHYGDIPASSWPAQFNLIQEAHAGFRIYKNLWLDAGFFKTHIGLESFQPRENVTSSMAILTFYEPYYLSGAKLTYEISSKFLVQVNAFNGYNEYVDNNKNKALGFSAVYNPIDNVSITYNFLTCDETPDDQPIKHQRYYNNLYATLKMQKLDVGFELNYGIQDRSLKSDLTKQATMKSALIVAEYNLNSKFSIYAREEYFSDPNQILTFEKSIGNYIYGTTGGVEIKPYRNIALSLESRMLRSDNLIFKQGSFYTNQRMEYIACLDVWF